MRLYRLWFSCTKPKIDFSEVMFANSYEEALKKGKEIAEKYDCVLKTIDQVDSDILKGVSYRKRRRADK